MLDAPYRELGPNAISCYASLLLPPPPGSLSLSLAVGFRGHSGRRLYPARPGGVGSVCLGSAVTAGRRVRRPPRRAPSQELRTTYISQHPPPSQEEAGILESLRQRPSTAHRTGRPGPTFQPFVLGFRLLELHVASEAQTQNFTKLPPNWEILTLQKASTFPNTLIMATF